MPPITSETPLNDTDIRKSEARQPEGAKTAAIDTSTLPPMLRQYREYKELYPDCLIFFQVGDFYEVFFEDAELVAQSLQLTLTTRDKSNPNPVPMCGVPISVVETYIARLVNAGHSVAQISQVGQAQAGKAGVARALERIVTPGMRLLSNDEDLKSRFVAAIVPPTRDDGAIAFSDIQSGRIYYQDSLSSEQLAREVARIEPSELIFPNKHADNILDRRSSLVQQLERVANAQIAKFRAIDKLRRRDPVSSSQYSPTAKRAINLLQDFIAEVSVNANIRISEVIEDRCSGEMVIDATTRTNLELIANSRDGGLHGSLFASINRCSSASGSRLLRAWILRPSANLNEIQARQDAVTLFLKQQQARESLRELLPRLPDLERITTRAELARVTPRELGALRDALLILPGIDFILAQLITARIQELRKQCKLEPYLGLELDRCLTDEPPAQLGGAPLIRASVDGELDRVRALQSEGHTWMAEFELRERARSGIGSLKVRANAVFGYFIEVTKSNLARVPIDYIRKQTTASGERYITEELRQRERELSTADSQIDNIERTHFERLRALVVENAANLRNAGRALAQIDVLVALAELAEAENYVAPRLVDQPKMEIEEGKHPVLAQLLRHDFVANSLSLGMNSERCAVVSGPNMGGKSTFLRQIALISILAQIGSYVPAKSALLGIVDRVFARIGASDNLLEGESTFLVEMREAAQIVSQASAHSLVLVDELGRGTATADGLAIARAVLEWLCTQSRSRTLFATHFHELTQLCDHLEGAFNLSVVAIQREDRVVFTHQIGRGAAGRSYGIEVAQLAGLPAELLARARQLLRDSESDVQPTVRTSTDPRQLSFFETPKMQPSGQELALVALRDKVSKIDPDEMSPRDALEKLYELREFANAPTVK